MFRSPIFSGRSPRRTSFRGLASSFAMAIALAGGAVTGTAFLTETAAAQSYSRGFVPVYQAAANIVNAEDGDMNAARAQFPAVIAAIGNDDDRNAAGNLILIAGNKLSDASLQRQGLELMLASGKVAPEQVGQFQFFVGNLAYQMEDYAAARTALNAAIAAGYSENDPHGLIAETYFQEENTATGIDYVMAQASSRMAAGSTVPENWLLRALQSAYDSNLTDKAVEVSEVLVTAYPTARNWTNTTQVIGAIKEYSDQQLLDLYRLMRQANAMTQRAEYIRYIEAADPRIMANEVGPLLAEGLAAGIFTSGENYYADVKAVVDQRSANNRTEAAALLREARGSSDGMVAIEAGNALLAINDYAQAEAMFSRALENGFADRDTALTRLGITQVKQGKFAEAQESFVQVSGESKPIARLWTIYAASQAG